MSANPVIITPQTGFATVLKPFFTPQKSFESVYQGQSSQIPIAVPGGLERSAAIGAEGYDPNLMEGSPVTMGGKVILWLPRIYNQYTPAPVYSYTVQWRVRSLADQSADPTRLLSGHLGRQLLGTPNNNNPLQPRFVIPTAVDTITYQQAEPSNPEAPGVFHVRTARYDVLAGAPLGTHGSGPFNVNSDVNAATTTRGIYTQGISPNPQGAITSIEPPNPTAGSPGGAVYVAITLEAKGDEMIVLIQRFDAVTPANEVWNFNAGGLDSGLSELLGTAGGTRDPLPNTGILQFCTSAV